MGFKYSCFISYRHGQFELTKTFVEQLYTALSGELETMVDKDVGVYIDKQRLLPGYFYNEDLAKAICQSICMLVVYSPSYEESDYCKREFEAMYRLQQQRFGLLGVANPESGMIIPVIFRGVLDDLPERMRG